MTTAELVLKKMKYNKESANIILFSLGKLVSIFGTSIYTFATGLYVLKATGSGLSFAATLILGMIPRVAIYPFAGVMADKFDKKVLVVTMDLLNGILLISLYTVSSIYGLNLIMIYVTTFLMTVFTSFFDISLEAAKPNIVNEKMLMNINSASRIIDSVSSILGPMIGGMVFAFVDIKVFIIVNGISFIFSGISEMFIDFRYNSKDEEEIKAKVNLIKDIREGFQYLIARKQLIRLFSTFIALNFFLGFSVSIPLPYIINNILELGSKEFGAIQGAFPAGMIIGAFFIGKASSRIPYNKMLIGTSYSLSLCMILIGLPILFSWIKLSVTYYLLYYCMTMMIFGVAISFIDIPIAYIMQKSIPDEYRGRVLSIGISIGKIILPVSLVLSGFLINIIPAYFITISGGVLLFIFNLFMVKAELD